MADKAISELVAAPSVTPDSLFVLQQDNTAKKLTAQVLENWLLSFAGGHGGIQSWVPLKKEGLVTTYRITLADQTHIDIDVVDGRGIESVKPTSTNGLVVTYTITYNDGNTDTITVTNGEKGDKGDNANVWIRYASQKPTASSHSFGEVADAWIGICSNHLETAPTDWQQYQWYQWKGEKGDPGEPATLVSSQITYQVGDSGTIIPSGSWSESIPPVSQGKYLWTREITQFNTGNPITKYSVSRFGIDGSGAVSTVAGIGPDADGNVPLTAADVKALPIGGGTMEGPINMNGQSLSGLNAPTKDDEAATKGYADELIRTAAPRNLLDNTDFRNPVNQRGFVSGKAVAAYGYFIDRWMNGEESTIKPNLSNNGIKPNGAFYQLLDSLSAYVGKKMTLAVGLSSGNVVTASGTLTEATTDDDVFIFDTTDGSNEIAVGSYGGHWYVWIDYPSSTIQWAALYEGEYTAETLPEYHPKGYGAELAECQRYYQIRSANNIAAVDMRPTMRLSSPTITSVTGGYAYSADL